MAQEIKPLSAAEKKHLLKRIERRNVEQAAIDEFVEFLKDAHGVGDGWQIAPDLSAWVYAREENSDV